MERVDLTKYVPQYSVKIKTWDSALQKLFDESITSVSVNEKVGGEPSEFTIVIADKFDVVSQKFTWLDKFLSFSTSPLYDDQKVFDISMGYRNNIVNMMTGRLENVSTSGFSEDITRLTLVGYDVSHKFLVNGSISQTKDAIKFEKKDTYSIIAEKLAKQMKLEYKIDPTPYYHDVTITMTGNYLDFLKDAAKKTGFTFLISRNKFYFIDTRKGGEHKVKEGDSTGGVGVGVGVGGSGESSSRIVLKWQNNLRDFVPTINFANLVPEVEVRGTLSTSREPISKTASTGEEDVIDSDKNKNIITGSRIAQKRDNPRMQVNNVNFYSSQEAEDISKALLNTTNDNLITASCTVVGNPHLVPGSYITIEGVGTQLTGKYFVTSVTNTIDTGGYSTRFNVSKNNIIVDN